MQAFVMNFNNKNMFFISKHRGLINTFDSESNLSFWYI
ncbi:hypothetical protein F952_02404 [Acinetobacter baylyi DSM 14961 = CIP 107474]|nr:hypothetical protein F952_02404 [Acinetobacter baylyi DSM 14961 = CIP 107474]